jgi:hypothetical protein
MQLKALIGDQFDCVECREYFLQEQYLSYNTIRELFLFAVNLISLYSSLKKIRC